MRRSKTKWEEPKIMAKWSDRIGPYLESFTGTFGGFYLLKTIILKTFYDVWEYSFCKYVCRSSL